MTRERPPIQVPATPGYFLAYCRELNRRAVLFGDADSAFELTPDTTLDDWEWKADVSFGRRDARRMEARWNMDRRPWAAWKAALRPGRERTVGDLCRFLAAGGAMRPAFEPIGCLGARPCAAAGAFAAVRSILRDAGADADAIEPSTPLEPYLRRHVGAFLHGIVAEAAPGALPRCRSETLCPPLAIFRVACVLAVPAAFLAILTALRMDFLADRIGFLLAIFPIAIFGMLAADAIDRRFHLTRYELVGLRTFKDLAQALALALAAER